MPHVSSIVHFWEQANFLFLVNIWYFLTYQGNHHMLVQGGLMLFVYTVPYFLIFKITCISNIGI